MKEKKKQKYFAIKAQIFCECPRVICIQMNKLYCKR